MGRERGGEKGGDKTQSCNNSQYTAGLPLPQVKHWLRHTHPWNCSPNMPTEKQRSRSWRSRSCLSPLLLTYFVLGQCKSPLKGRCIRWSVSMALEIRGTKPGLSSTKLMMNTTTTLMATRASIVFRELMFSFILQ